MLVKCKNMQQALHKYNIFIFFKVDKINENNYNKLSLVLNENVRLFVLISL